MKTPRGFTLVEVLVAMVIMAVMAGMAWQGVDGIVRARDASQAKLESALRLNTVIAQWDQDLASTQKTNVVPEVICDGASVRMARRTPEGVQVVAWTLRPVGDNLSVWERWAGPAVQTSGELTDSWLRSLQLQGNEPGSLRALTGLSTWQVYFYRGNTWTNCQSSDGVTPPASPASAAVIGPTRPDGVRVVLTFAPGTGLAGDLTRDTLLKR
ncbi:MAG: prepilin-type N-terminal cleavage/methylation domain-containing protein [Burkholderiales bacterium]